MEFLKITSPNKYLVDNEYIKICHGNQLSQTFTIILIIEYIRSFTDNPRVFVFTKYSQNYLLLVFLMCYFSLCFAKLITNIEYLTRLNICSHFWLALSSQVITPENHNRGENLDIISHSREFDPQFHDIPMHAI